jgi:hypothetical protein
VRYLVLDPCFHGDDLARALEDRLNDLAGDGWRLVAVVPVRGLREVNGETQVSEDFIETIVFEKA